MAMLHTINKSPFEKSTLDSCLRFAKEGASILFIEDGVYAALKGTAVSDKVQGALGKLKLYVLEPDLKARGMDAAQVIEGIEPVDYGGFVDLTVAHDNVHSWV